MEKYCNVSSHMYYLQFTFKGAGNIRHIAFLLILLEVFWNIKKSELFFFSD